MSGDGLPFPRPITSDGREVHIGWRVKWIENGEELEGRVRAFDAWGKLQIVVVHDDERGPREYEKQSRDVQFECEGW